MTVAVQLELAFRLVPQSFDSWKRVKFVPVSEMPLMVSGVAPVFVRAIVCGGGGQGRKVGFVVPSLHVKLSSAGMSLSVPLERVMVAVAVLVVSAAALALRVAVALAGSEAGAVNVVVEPLGVVAGLTVPQPGEHAVPF